MSLLYFFFNNMKRFYFFREVVSKSTICSTNRKRFIMDANIAWQKIM